MIINSIPITDDQLMKHSKLYLLIALKYVRLVITYLTPDMDL